MTPGARIAAAIEVLDAVAQGASAEHALTGWSRRSRFAGSGDRRAVRDLVFDALRRWRSYAALGGSDCGRGVMIGALRAKATDPATLMTGQGHAPPPPGPAEEPRPSDDPAVQADLPDWLFSRFEADLGDAAMAVATTLRDRAPVFVRVNTRRSTREAAQLSLARDGIAARPASCVSTALEVTGNEPKISQSRAYVDGLIELQDASSQAAVLALPLAAGDAVLDYCAGGGGKALAIAARMPVAVTAHDANPARLRDLPVRAARAGEAIALAGPAALEGQRFDLVLVDAPCSGSGTWRRDPQGKWRLTPEGLEALSALQLQILAEAARFVRPGGHLAYATCSVLDSENRSVIDRFCDSRTGFAVVQDHRWLPGPDGDGFYLAVMRAEHPAT